MIDADSLRLCLGLLALLPLSYLLQRIQTRRMREFYSTVGGFLLQLMVYRGHMLPIYVQHFIVFAMIRLKGRRCGALVTLQAMLFLSAYHIHEYLTDYGGWSMRASGLLMILVCKYSLLAYDLQDGGEDERGLTEEQRRNRVTGEVGFWEFMGYLNFLPTALIGPPLEYNDYKNYIERGEVYGSIPSVAGVTLRALGETVLFGALHLLGDYYLPIAPLKTDPFYLQPAWYILLYSTASVYLIRCKYYFGWKLSLAAVHASGASFNGHNFSRINTVDPYTFETSIHVRDKINAWNISVQEWLRKSVYQRSPLKSKIANQLYVFVVSAFWHGFYSAYYISEVLWFGQLYLQGLVFKYFNGRDTVVGRWYRAAGRVGTILLGLLVSFEFSHNSTYFVILEGEFCWKFMKRLYFVPELALVVLIVVFWVLPVPKGKKDERRAEEKKE